MGPGFLYVVKGRYFQASRFEDGMVKMKCKNCKRKNLYVWERSRPITRIDTINGQLRIIDPRKIPNLNKKHNILCKDCGHIFMADNLHGAKIKPSLLNQKKLVLDLDQTIIANVDYEDGYNFDFQLENKIYVIKVRDYFNKFIEFAKEYFDEIHVCTAATKGYAEKVVKGLGLENVIKSITSRESLNVERTLTKFDREYIKEIDNAIIIEDKPEVVKGNGNTIFQVKPYHGFYPENDKEFLKILNILKNQNPL